MSAKQKQGMAAVEEWLQEKYVEYYEDSENYINKPELLASKIQNLFLKEGSKNYVTVDGKIYYLLNKEVVPEEIRAELLQGESKEYASYARLIDVYGVTSNLKLYYCNSVGDVIYGKYDNIEINPKTPLTKANQNETLKKTVSQALGKADGEELTLADGQALKELTLTEITNISGIEEMKGLKKLVLVNSNINNLDGLMYCTKLEHLYLNNCVIENYGVLPEIYGLKYLYINIPVSRKEGANEEIERLSLAMSKAEHLTNLEYLGIFGVEYAYNYTIGLPGRDASTVLNTNVNSLTSIESLSIWNKTVKDKIKYCYFNNNGITSVDFLASYGNIYEIWLFGCVNLQTLDGLKNHKNITNLVCQDTLSLDSLGGLSGTTKLSFLSIQRDSNLTSLKGLEKSVNLVKLYAFGCNIQDIESLKQINEQEKYIGKLNYLNLENNLNLQNVRSISSCTTIRNLYLAGNTSMINDDVKEIENIIILCGTNYSIPSKYQILFANTTELDLSGSEYVNINDYSTEISAIKLRTNLKYLRLYGRNKLGKSKLAKLIKEGNLKFNELDVILNNLSELTEDQKEYINTLKLKGEANIKEMNDSEINLLEPKDSDIYLRYVLSNLTDLRKLSVGEITSLTSIDFINKAKSLSELDYRGTNITNVTLLNTNAKRLVTLYTNGSKTDLSTIQPALEAMYDNMRSGVDSNIKCAFAAQSYGAVAHSGIRVNKYEGIENLFKNCKSMKKIDIGYIGVDSEIDLTGCSALKDIWASNGLLKLPCRELDSVFTHNGHFECLSGTKINQIRYGESHNWSSDCESLKNAEIKNYISGARYESNSLVEIGKLSGSFDSLISLSTFSEVFDEYYWGNINDCGNFSYLSNFKKLEKIIYSGYRDSDILTGVENLKTLKYLNVRSNEIKNISGIHSLTNLENLYFDDNKIQNLTYADQEGNSKSIFEELTSLSTLELSNNQIEDLKPLECLIKEDGSTNLKILNIKNNSLERYSVAGTDNLEIIKKFQKAGCDVSYDSSAFEN